MPRTTPDARRYFVAILVAAAALLLRKALSPLLGTDSPFITAWAATFLSAWYFGVGPSLACALISVLGVWYWFLPYSNSFRFQSPKAEIARIVIFSVFSGFVIALGEANRRSKAGSKREAAERERVEEELRRAQAELESRVRERTAELNVANQKISQEAAIVRERAEWLDAASDAIFVGDSDERITYWNKGAERLYGWTKAEAIGKEAHQLLDTEFPIPFVEIARQREQAGWEGELVHTRRDGTKVTVTSRWTPLKDARRKLRGWLEINRDISDRKAAEAACQLNAELMKIQDEERRRIARVLHEGTGQMVVALMLNLGRLKASENLSLEEIRLLAESDALLQNVNSELCAISHLLHPLLLDEAGLWTALEWYLEGLRQRSGIAATLERDSNFGRLPSELEVAIFRVVQECLKNMQPHSGSSEVTVRLLRPSGEMRLEVQHQDRGILAEQLSNAAAMGAGLKGMRERIAQLGGNLSVESNGGGTIIAVTFPVSKAADASDNEKAVA